MRFSLVYTFCFFFFVLNERQICSNVLHLPRLKFTSHNLIMVVTIFLFPFPIYIKFSSFLIQAPSSKCLFFFCFSKHKYVYAIRFITSHRCAHISFGNRYISPYAIALNRLNAKLFFHLVIILFGSGLGSGLAYVSSDCILINIFVMQLVDSIFYYFWCSKHSFGMAFNVHICRW